MRSFVPDYDLVCAGTLEEALRLRNEGWRPIAGGTDLMVLFNAGQLPHRKLVSVRAIPELREIRIADDAISLGAAVTYREIGDHPVLRRELPLLCEAAGLTGAIANQNRGTLGGNIVNASPAADSPPALLVNDAEVELRSEYGARRVPYSQFHTGYKATQIREDELLVAIHLPRRSGDWRQYFRKVGPRRAMAISKVCFAAAARMRDGVVEDIRIAVGAVAPVPMRCFEAEAAVLGGDYELAQSAIRSEVQPITDMRSTEEYRRAVTANLLGEFLSGLR